MNAQDHSLAALIRRAATGERLDAAEAEAAIGALFAGAATPVQAAALLTALSTRGATADEIAGGARALRANMVRVTAPDGAMDVCGTGGDGSGSLNVSTAVAFVVAACGVPVAKHGNRAMSSRAGSADVLEALGVRIDVPPETAEKCLADAGICFMFAPSHHPATRNVGAVRRELGFRTIFNLLGPLSNPAGVTRQVTGVYSADAVELVAHALRDLGTVSAWVVHGIDGVDEISIEAPTRVAAVKDGAVTMFEVTPEDAGLSRSPMSALQGGDALENAVAIHALLGCEQNAFRDIVVLNAAAALVVAGKARDLKDGAAQAVAAIDGGGARGVLDRFAAASRG